MGAVAYDPKVVTIWEGFRRWFATTDLPFDYVLYSNYERQVEDLLAGRIHVAWNSPLAWVRARRLAAAGGSSVAAMAMRDTDRDLTSVVVVRADSPIVAVADLPGRTVGHRRGRLAAGHAPAPRPAPSGGRQGRLRCDASTLASACTATTSAVSGPRPRPWWRARWRPPA